MKFQKDTSSREEWTRNCWLTMTRITLSLFLLIFGFDVWVAVVVLLTATSPPFNPLNGKHLRVIWVFLGIIKYYI